MTKGQYIRTKEIKEKNSKSRKGKGIGTCGKYIRTKEIKEKQSLKMEGRPTSEYQKEIQRKRMSGIENPMNNLECVEKISGKNCHLFGKPPIPGRFYLYQSPLQGEIKLNHSWELAYAEYLDFYGEPWYHECKTFEFEFNNKQTSYTPDFYLPLEKRYVEIKGRWIRDSEQKFNRFKQQYPEIKIDLLMKKDLKKLGIRIK